MGTKTITIMDDAYKLLADNKLSEESFSDEIRRVLTQNRTKPLKDFFGILSDDVGKEMLNDLKKIKSVNLKLLRKKLK